MSLADHVGHHVVVQTSFRGAPTPSPVLVCTDCGMLLTPNDPDPPRDYGGLPTAPAGDIGTDPGAVPEDYGPWKGRR